MNDERAAAMTALAALLRSGLTLRQALLRWPDETGDSARRPTEQIAARVRLGWPAVAALDGTGFERVLATPFSLHLSSGMDLAGWLDDAAARLEERGASVQAARAASSGAVLSGRMVAGLPLLFVPLVPMTRSPMADATGLVILLAGVALACAGLRWIGRLVPAPPQEDAVGAFCTSVATLVDAGLGLTAALDAAARDLEAPGPRRAQRLVRLGWSWSEALAETEPSFVPMCRAIDAARALGLPVAAQLRALERSRRITAAREFDRRLKRAPVLMVVPLTCCVLPAYGLLGLAPFLRGMSMG